MTPDSLKHIHTRNFKKVAVFMQHCCRMGQYTFDTLICHSDSWTLLISLYLRLVKIDNFFHFWDCLGVCISDQHCPSFYWWNWKAKFLLFIYMQCMPASNKWIVLTLFLIMWNATYWTILSTHNYSKSWLPTHTIVKQSLSPEMNECI